MEKVFEKISGYNIVNNFIPGVVYAFFLNDIIKMEILKDDIIFNLCVFYIVGMFVSRFGSLIIESLLKKIGFIKYVEYKSFIKASQKDEKLNALVESNNLSRTIISMLFLMILSYCISFIGVIKEYKEISFIILGILLLILMIISYKKQTDLIRTRVYIDLEGDNA